MNDEKTKQGMQEVLDLVLEDIGTIRTGRATPSLVENITIFAYGGTQNLKVNELATITVPDAQTVIIDPWDKSIIGEIKKGLLTANVGMNPNIDGELIRISMPPMTTEDREKYVKLLSAKVESGKVMIRQVRGEAMKDIKSVFEKKEITEDEKFRQEKRLQETADDFVEKIQKAQDNKEKELLQV